MLRRRRDTERRPCRKKSERRRESGARRERSRGRGQGAPRKGVPLARERAQRSPSVGSPEADAALAILPKGYAAPVRARVELLLAAPPAPVLSSVRAARRSLAFFRSFSDRDVVLCLVSGGASSLLCLPRPGVTLAKKRAAVSRAMASGASIVEINRLRKRLSAVKGGKLGRATLARLVTLVISDVPGDDPAIVGSGPTVRGRRGDLVSVVASNRAGLLAAARQARARGDRAHIVTRRLEGEARQAGLRFGLAARRLEPGAA